MKLKTRELVLAALLAALLIAAKQAMSFIPNFEPVTLLLILYTLHFPRMTPLIIYVFVAVQVLLYGFNVWVYMYLYIWIILYAVVRLLARWSSYPLWIIVAAVYGMLFGLLCSPVYLFIGGWNMVWPAALPSRGFCKPKSSPARSRAGELSRLFCCLVLHAQRPDPLRPIVGVALVSAFIQVVIQPSVSAGD